jgi:hypothetical protein
MKRAASNLASEKSVDGEIKNLDASMHSEN